MGSISPPNQEDKAPKSKKAPKKKSIPKNLKHTLFLAEPNPRLEKQEKITNAIKEESFLKLRSLALSPMGLVNNELRSKAW
ncbi:hypothetical protein DSO57_1007615 [Entomophthora muscae]|uniref:Uncharacterized protein n=1 Tax=Entomophthora muscae TaxID=34485 RepID=A0ACC2RYH9_9FUNG|nr:hypothetical protein DSO57_1007615 [Entomophthora muscae]